MIIWSRVQHMTPPQAITTCDRPVSHAVSAVIIGGLRDSHVLTHHCLYQLITESLIIEMIIIITKIVIKKHVK